MKYFSLLFFFLFTTFNSANAQREYPVLNEIVTDNANIFSESELLQLRQKLTDYETKTSHQIVVLTIEYLGNDSIENYAIKPLI